MFLRKIKKVSPYEHGTKPNDDGIRGNPNWKDFDVDDRSHWAYVGLSDEEFEGKKKEIAHAKHMLLTHDDDDYYCNCYAGYRDVFEDEAPGMNFSFFGVYENEGDASPVAYLCLQWRFGGKGLFDNDERGVTSRSMALASEVDGWEMGRIQAYLMNLILAPTYLENYDRYEAKVVPFEENGKTAKVASVTASADGFRFCRMENPGINGKQVSEIELEALEEC
jgi:hypothetical protein